MPLPALRTVRAVLPHTALQSVVSASWSARQRMSFAHSEKSMPSEVSTFASFDAVFQRRQHVFCPDRGFHPTSGFCSLFSTASAVHWRHVAYALPVTGFHTSTFLPPFPRRGFALQAFRGSCRYSTMEALTPAHVTSRAGLPAYRTMPSDHSISNHLTYPCRSFNTLPISSAGPLHTGTGFALLPAGSPVSPGRIEFVILRTGRSPPVAPHPASRRRSYVWFQARRAIDLTRTFTSLTSCAHGRTG